MSATASDMTPERWRELKAVVQEALESPPGDRGALLARACGADAELRRAAEALLAAAEASDSFLDAPAAERVAQRREAPADEPRLAERMRAGLAERLEAAHAGRYVIERELGRGGMATVFLARDLARERRVALKVLHPGLAAFLGPGRFQREVETAATLSHPHILPLHESGDAGGLLYYTMPFVAGASLRERLRRDVRLAPPEALGIVRDVADALDYAHRRGVVHRDVKPENVLLDEGAHVLVADFGIAAVLHGPRESGATAGPPSEPLTRTGAVLGTAAYMSPEQAMGKRDVDGRSDVYALGCVAFELLAGETPFRGSIAEQISTRVTARPPPLTTCRPDLPPAIDTVLARALALARAERFPTAGSFAEALGAALLGNDAPPQAVRPTASILRPTSAADPENESPPEAAGASSEGVSDAMHRGLRKAIGCSDERKTSGAPSPLAGEAPDPG